MKIIKIKESLQARLNLLPKQGEGEIRNVRCCMAGKSSSSKAGRLKTPFRMFTMASDYGSSTKKGKKGYLNLEQL